MSHFEIIYLYFRTVEVSGDETKPQYQIYFKTDKTLPYQEESPRSIVRFKAIPQTKLYFRLYIHKPNDVAIVNNSITLKEMNLTPFEPKTFCLPFKTEKGDNILLVYDIFSYYISPEQEKPTKSPTLIDFNLLNLSNMEYLIEKVEKPMKKAHKVGFSMVEYELVVEYLKQNYTLKFFSNDSAPKTGSNVFVTTDEALGNMNVKLLAHEYEWFVEGQKKTLRASKTLGEQTLNLKDLVQQTKANVKKIVGEFGIEFTVSTRESSFLQNFVGNVNFRVFSTTFFTETITNPVLVLKQLGSNIQWTLDPYSSVQRKNEYIWDYEYQQLRNEFKPKTTEEEKRNEDFSSLFKKASGTALFPIDTPPNTDVQAALDFLYQIEDDENNLEKENLNLQNQKNGAFFSSRVPNETIVLEVYQNSTLLGYAFFPLANINIDQNFCEKIVPLGSQDKYRNLGEIKVRVQFEPINVGVGQDIFNQIGSLDFDDISERFFETSKFHEACFLMDKNIENAKSLIWPKRISNSFSDLASHQKFILNVKDILNLSEVFSKEIDFGDMELRVRISDQQQIVKFAYSETTLRELKDTHPKEYFLFTQVFYKQVLIEEDHGNTIIFKIKGKKDMFGVVKIAKHSQYHHFEFVVQHPKESFSISLFSGGKPLDYNISTLDSLPLAEEVDSLQFPFQVPLQSERGLPEKGILFVKLETMTYPEEGIAGDFTSGVFVLQRIKMQDSGNKIHQADLKGKYDLEIQTPQGLIHRIINLGSDISVDRTYFEHLAEIKKEEGVTNVKLIMRKIVKNSLNEYEDSSMMPVLFETEFSLTSSDAVNDEDYKTICLKPNTGTERKVEIKDEIGHKGSPTILNFNFYFVYKVNKFIDSPEGVLNIRLSNSEVEELKEITSLKTVNSLKVFLSDANKEIRDTASYVYMERSLDDHLNQPKIQTYDWTNKLVIESYESDEKLQGRAFIHLSDIPFTSQEEVIKLIVINGVRMNFVFSYVPLLSDDAQGEFSLKMTSAKDGGVQGSGDKKGGRGKTGGILENLKQRIKDLETENLVLRTNVNKVNVTYTKKLNAIEKLKAYNSNFEEAKKSTSKEEGKSTTTSKSTQSAATKSKLKELYNSICQCGKPAPKFKGYCADCLKDLKQQYEQALAEYMPLAEKYEGVTVKKHNFWKKKDALEKKIQNYERKAKEFNFDFINEEEEMLKDELKNLKAKLIDKKNEIEIMQHEHYFKIEEMKSKQKILEDLLDKKGEKLKNLKTENLERTQE